MISESPLSRSVTRSKESGPRAVAVDSAECSVASRLRATLQGDDVLRKAMRRHVERCSTCREELLRQEPTTVFRRMPRVELSADEVSQMRQRVQGVRRARRVGGADLQGSGPVGPARRPVWAAAAAATAATVLLVGGLAAFQAGLMSGPSVTPTSSVSALTAEDEAQLDRALASRALIEGDDVLSEQVVVMQVAGHASDLAWVANDRLDL